MIPKYPYTVMVEYQPNRKRQPISKAHETLPGAMAVYNEHVGRTDVRRVTIALIIEVSEKALQISK